MTAPVAGRPVVVEARGLTKTYGTQHAVDHIDFEVREGSVYGLVGPNGSGKTTLLSMIAGLRRPSSGALSVHVDHSRVALLPDTPKFEPWLTAVEVVDLARHLVDPAIPVARVREVLADAGLSEAVDRRCGGFSRGMLQRLGLAATLIGAPSLMLMDEPSSALDPVGRREILDLVAEQRGQRTVIFSSHILADVQEVCDTVGVMRQGRLVYQGPLAELLTGSASPAYHVRLRGDEADVEAVRSALVRMPWIRAVEVVGAGHLRVAVVSLDEAEREIAGALAAAGARVVSLRPEEASLERVFLEMTA